MNGIIDNKERQYLSTWEVYKALWRASPNEKLYANDTPGYYQKMSTDQLNLLASTDPDVSGYNKIPINFQSSMELEYVVPFVKGLKVKGLFSYDTSIADNSIFRKNIMNILTMKQVKLILLIPNRVLPNWNVTMGILGQLYGRLL